ncbi:transposase [uncultured Thiodictyon sp.]|uniref:transposase n=1 Tax=uncultured Thiodictyon sp. TaxID=1846217 RepID=UPI0025FB86B0|nr:transposase [uncultured Thiodictyon sp.]
MVHADPASNPGADHGVADLQSAARHCNPVWRGDRAVALLHLHGLGEAGLGPVWEVLWRAIPDPLTDGRLLLAVDDSVNPKARRKVFACQDTFDHAAKTNQRRFPSAQTIATVWLLKIIHGRWCCLPLAFAFYFRYLTLHTRCVRVRGEAQVFQTEFAQVVALIVRLRAVFIPVPVLVVCDSCFGNNGLIKPLREHFGARAHLLSRLRHNVDLYELQTPTPGRPGRPRKYGVRAGTSSQLAPRSTPRPRTTGSICMAGCARWWPSSDW